MLVLSRKTGESVLIDGKYILLVGATSPTSCVFNLIDSTTGVTTIEREVQSELIDLRKYLPKLAAPVMFGLSSVGGKTVRLAFQSHGRVRIIRTELNQHGSKSEERTQSEDHCSAGHSGSLPVVRPAARS